MILSRGKPLNHRTTEPGSLQTHRFPARADRFALPKGIVGNPPQNPPTIASIWGPSSDSDMLIAKELQTKPVEDCNPRKFCVVTGSCKHRDNTCTGVVFLTCSYTRLHKHRCSVCLSCPRVLDLGSHHEITRNHKKSDFMLSIWFYLNNTKNFIHFLMVLLYEWQGVWRGAVPRCLSRCGSIVANRST